MAQQDFDIDSLAAYLHVTPAQVAKMADRGRLPGRKIGGSWRFSKAEIHHWLEDRIGLSDDDELAQVEGLLDRAEATDEAISIAELLPTQAIALPLAARTRSSVISGMCELAAGSGLLWDAEKMIDAVRARENLHPTAIDSGVALLHPRRPMSNLMAEAFLALGITPQGIPFGSSKGSLTDVFFLICSTSDREHLRILARLSRLIADSTLLGDLRNAGDSQLAHDLIRKREQEI